MSNLASMTWGDFSRYLSEDMLETTIRRTAENDPTVVGILDIQLKSYREKYGENYLEIREQRTDEEVGLLHERANNYKYGCAEKMFDKLQNL